MLLHNLFTLLHVYVLTSVSLHHHQCGTREHTTSIDVMCPPPVLRVSDPHCSGDRSLVAADRFLLFWRSFLVARRMLRLAVRSMCTNLSLVFTLKLTLFRRPTPRPS